MTWEQAEQKIINSILGDTQLTDTRKVLKIPPYKCENYDYDGEGFRVKIGTTQEIEIPLSMLQTVFNDATSTGGIYNKDIFRIHYPDRAEQTTGHPCHIHVIGKMLQLADVAEPIDSRTYRLLN